MTPHYMLTLNTTVIGSSVKAKPVDSSEHNFFSQSSGTGFPAIYITLPFKPQAKAKFDINPWTNIVLTCRYVLYNPLWEYKQGHYQSHLYILHCTLLSSLHSQRLPISSVIFQTHGPMSI